MRILDRDGKELLALDDSPKLFSDIQFVLGGDRFIALSYDPTPNRT